MVAPRSSTTQRAGRIKDARGRPVSQLDAVKLHLLNQHAIIPAARRFRGVFFVRPPSEESFRDRRRLSGSLRRQVRSDPAACARRPQPVHPVHSVLLAITALTRLPARGPLAYGAASQNPN